MPDVFPVDYTSEVGRVRKYIPDLQQLPDPRDPSGTTSFIFTDNEIKSFIQDETGVDTVAQTWQLRRAAAWAMLAIANNENLILKKIVTEDQQTDGPAVAKELRTSAETLFRLADEERVRLGSAVLFIDVPYNDPVRIPEPRAEWRTWPYPGAY